MGHSAASSTLGRGESEDPRNTLEVPVDIPGIYIKYIGRNKQKSCLPELPPRVTSPGHKHNFLLFYILDTHTHAFAIGQDNTYCYHH